MKKISFILLSLLITLTGCNNDDDGPQDQPKPVPVTITSTDNNTRYSSEIQKMLDLRNLIVPAKSLSSTSTRSISYEGRHITKISTTEGSDISVSNYYYNDMDAGLLDSIVTIRNGEFYSKKEYDINNGQILAIREYDENREMTYQSTFSNYNNGHPLNINIQIVSQGMILDLSGTLNYNGNDVANYNLSGENQGVSITMTQSFSYDDKNNIFLNVETVESPITSEHNITENNMVLAYFNMSSQTHIQTVYSYNEENYPITSSATIESEFPEGGTQILTYNEEIDYEDK